MQAKRLIRELTRISDQTSNTLFTTQQMREIARRIGVSMDRFDDLISTLNNESYLLKKGGKTYQLQTAG
jgi:DNA helicase MCM8